MRTITKIVLIGALCVILLLSIASLVVDYHGLGHILSVLWIAGVYIISVGYFFTAKTTGIAH